MGGAHDPARLLATRGMGGAASGGGSSTTTTTAGGNAIRRSRHRQYGLSNANQVLLALVVNALLFFALLRPRWLVFDADVAAGLWSIVVPVDAAADKTLNSSVTVSWRAFCDPAKRNFTLPIMDGIPQPISADAAATLCRELRGYALLPEVMRALVATAIGFALLTLLVALYLQLGRPTRSQIFYCGLVPALALLLAAVLCMVALILWQHYYGAFDNSDCVAVAIAATVIAYLVAVSMIIRWRWPGICAVPNEQQAFQSRRSYRTAPPRRSNTFAAAHVHHTPLDNIQITDTTDAPPPRTTAFHQMNS